MPMGGEEVNAEINRCINASCQDYVWKTSRWGGVYDNYNHQSHRQFLNNNHSFNHHHLWITRYINLSLSTLIIIIFFIIWYTFTNNILWKETELPLTHTNEPMPYKNLDESDNVVPPVGFISISTWYSLVGVWILKRLAWAREEAAPKWTIVPTIKDLFGKAKT